MGALLDGGSLKLYGGTQPLSANTAVTSQPLLVTLTFGTPAFAPAVAGVAQANTITAGTAALDGDAKWFRACKADGSAVQDGSVGTADCDCNLSSTNILANSPVSISSFSITQPEG